jgi:hypothetical protein
MQTDTCKQLPTPLRYLLLASKEKMIQEIEELWYQREMLRKLLAIEDQELWNAQHQVALLGNVVSELAGEVEELWEIRVREGSK